MDTKQTVEENQRQAIYILFYLLLLFIYIKLKQSITDAGRKASLSRLCHGYRYHGRGEARSKATCLRLHLRIWEVSQPRIMGIAKRVSFNKCAPHFCYSITSGCTPSREAVATNFQSLLV